MYRKDEDYVKKESDFGRSSGLFLFGVLYASFDKRGLIAFVALMAVSIAISAIVGPNASFIVSIAGAYLSYKWCNEHNEAIGG